MFIFVLSKPLGVGAFGTKVLSNCQNHAFLKSMCLLELIPVVESRIHVADFFDK